VYRTTPHLRSTTAGKTKFRTWTNSWSSSHTNWLTKSATCLLMTTELTSLTGNLVETALSPSNQLGTSLGSNIESLSYVFLEGPEISKVWEFFARKFNTTPPSKNNITLFLSYWRFSSIGKIHIRTLISMLILWFYWLERNDAKHREQKFNSDRIIRKVHQFINTISRTKLDTLLNWKGDANIASTMGLLTYVKRRTTLMKVKWNKPDRGWIKINTDGATKGNPGPAGAGGIARDERGATIFAFYEFIGEATNVYVEVYELFKALQICQTENFNRIWI
ncbi:UNVERIFIED_CONTAM: putative ribonuclease H protein, partial [Sesamum indicum]